MALIYRIGCASCGQGPAILDDVRPDRRGPVTVVDSFIELTTRDGQQVTLAHPAESEILKDYGYTWKSASAQQRLELVTPRICSACGHLFLYREPFRPITGCLRLVILPAGVFAVVMFMEASTALALALSFGTLSGLSFLQQRHNRQSAALPTSTACPVCGRDTVELNDIGTRRMPCVSCGAMAVQCEATAIS